MNTLKKMSRSCLGSLSIALLLATAGCGGGGGGGEADGGGGGNPPAVVVGSAGGTVTGPDGVTVVIPAGALSADVSLRIAAADPATPMPLPAGIVVSKPMYDLLPHGTRFSVPATLSVPRAAADPASGMSLLKTNADNSGWLQLPTETTATAHVALINGFSRSVVYCGGSCGGPSPPPVISIAAPPSVTAIENSTAVFGVAAIGHYPLTYQWFKDGVAIPSQTSSSIALTMLPLGYDGARVHVLVTDGQRPALTVASAPTIVNVTPYAPTILAHPGDVEAVVGSTATFQVATASSVPQNFVWERRNVGSPAWTSIGANSHVLTLANVQFTDDRSEYRVKAYNGDQILGVISNPARLTVTAAQTAPVITEQPRDQTTVAGRSVTLRVLATGGGLAYDWFRADPNADFRLLQDENSASLTLSNASIADNGARYRVQLRNSQGSAESSIATLSVAPTVTLQAKRLGGGEAHSIGLKGDATLYSWGLNLSGQLGRGATATPEQPGAITPAPFRPVVTTFDVGHAHGLYLDDGGFLASWGRGNEGQLGDGSSTSLSSPQGLPGQSFRSVVAGVSQSAAIHSSTSELYSWGSGYRADGLIGSLLIPTRMPGNLFVQLAMSKHSPGHNLGVQANGSVWAWGSNAFGQLGSGNLDAATTPQAVPTLGDVVEVAAGGGFSLALTRNGTVYGWGRNHLGQTGTGSGDFRILVPTIVALPGIAVGIVAGDSHAAVLLSDGRVFVWGDNSDGQLGNASGAGLRSATPIPVVGAWQGPITSLGAGYRHTLVLDAAGNVWGWGRNNFSQLGSQAGPTDRPVQVPGVNLN